MLDYTVKPRYSYHMKLSKRGNTMLKSITTWQLQTSLDSSRMIVPACAPLYFNEHKPVCFLNEKDVG